MQKALASLLVLGIGGEVVADFTWGLQMCDWKVLFWVFGGGIIVLVSQVR
jgi:hypothetical protein